MPPYNRCIIRIGRRVFFIPSRIPTTRLRGCFAIYSEIIGKPFESICANCCHVTGNNDAFYTVASAECIITNFLHRSGKNNLCKIFTILKSMDAYYLQWLSESDVRKCVAIIEGIIPNFSNRAWETYINKRATTREWIFSNSRHIVWHRDAGEFIVVECIIVDFVGFTSTILWESQFGFIPQIFNERYGYSVIVEYKVTDKFDCGFWFIVNDLLGIRECRWNVKSGFIAHFNERITVLECGFVEVCKSLVKGYMRKCSAIIKGARINVGYAFSDYNVF